MHHRLGGALFAGILALTLLAPPAHGEIGTEQRALLIQPRAHKLRQLLGQQASSAEPMEREVDAALRRALAHWQADEPQAALQALAPLQKFAPIAELPFIKAQLLLAAMAQQARQGDLVQHHRAWARALVASIEASGNGASKAGAYRLVMAAELDGWLIAQSDTHTLLSQRWLQSGARRYVVVDLKSGTGARRRVYFELAGTADAPARMPYHTAAN